MPVSWARRTVKVTVAGDTKFTPTGTGRNPAINERLEFVLSGTSAKDSNMLIEIEIWDYKWINDRKGSKTVSRSCQDPTFSSKAKQICSQGDCAQ